MGKKTILIVFAVVIIIATLLFSFKDVLFAPTPFGLNVSIGNAPPEIIFVSDYTPNPAIPNEGTFNTISFFFLATDSNGLNTLDDSTAYAKFEKIGEALREDVLCSYTGITDDGLTKNYSCQIDMWYWDAPGIDWRINTTIQDIPGLKAENSTTNLTYIESLGFQIDSDFMAWSGLTIPVPAPGIGADNNPMLINNTANQNVVDGGISVTGIDLVGETNQDDFIYAGNFSIDEVTAGCVGDKMQNATDVVLNGAFLSRGNNSINTHDENSGQEDLFFCITGVNPIESQLYSTHFDKPWILTLL